MRPPAVGKTPRFELERLTPRRGSDPHCVGPQLRLSGRYP
jgi:hypothetical protein